MRGSAGAEKLLFILFVIFIVNINVLHFQVLHAFSIYLKNYQTCQLTRCRPSFFKADFLFEILNLYVNLYHSIVLKYKI